VTTAALKMSVACLKFCFFKAVGGVAKDSHHRFFKSRYYKSSFENVVVACLKFGSF
jgi:hypothetical protein